MVIYLPGAGRLAQALREELDALRALIGTLHRERDALNRADTEALSKVVEEKLAAAEAVAAWSRARRNAIARCGGSSGHRVTAITENRDLTAAVEATAGGAAMLNDSNEALLVRHTTRILRTALLRDAPSAREKRDAGPALLIVAGR